MLWKLSSSMIRIYRWLHHSWGLSFNFWYIAGAFFFRIRKLGCFIALISFWEKREKKYFIFRWWEENTLLYMNISLFWIFLALNHRDVLKSLFIILLNFFYGFEQIELFFIDGRNRLWCPARVTRAETHRYYYNLKLSFVNRSIGESSIISMMKLLFLLRVLSNKELIIK